MASTVTRMNPADLWDLCVPLLWDDNYISSLEGLLRENGITTILDCGGGTGFPAIGLRANGWKVSYVDKSNEMLETFQGNCARHNVHIPTYQADWLQLSHVLADRFDAVLCRGNSLVYVGILGRQLPRAKQQDISSASHSAILSLSKSRGVAVC